jgi:hypothetical protein
VVRAYLPGIYQVVDVEDMNYLIDRSVHFVNSNLGALVYPVWLEDFNVTITDDTHSLNMQKLKGSPRSGEDQL